MSSDMRAVKYVVEVDPNQVYRDQSDNVNDYLAIDGWIMLEVGKKATFGDSGQVSWIYDSVGWIGAGDPVLPPKQPNPDLEGLTPTTSP